ncbi:hypothetical protein [Saccharicrinis sp. FJH54]|uniref:hypothetical protein n=1 Tax=Saccharicrinis sp. FJH54 TaxID=3344665 RepID=UPI0035D47F9C
MTEKEKHIIEFIKSKDCKSYYIDIRDKLGEFFDNESDFDNHLESLKLKNWIYENEPGDTLFIINQDMLKAIDYKISLAKYDIKSTGAGGGHKYISAQIDFNGKTRKMIATFLSKTDENRLENMSDLEICGDLIDEGEKYDLTLLNTEIIN